MALLDIELPDTDDDDTKYIVNLWKAFCRSRKALSLEYNTTDAVINKWNIRFFKISSV